MAQPVHVPASPPRAAHRPAAARACVPRRGHDAGVHLRPRRAPPAASRPCACAGGGPWGNASVFGARGIWLAVGNTPARRSARRAMSSRTKSRTFHSTRSDASTRGDEHGGVWSLPNGAPASESLTVRHNRPLTVAPTADDAYRKHAAKTAASTLFDKAPAEARRLRRASHPAKCCVGVWDLSNAAANGSTQRSAGRPAAGLRRSQSAGPARPTRPARPASGSARASSIASSDRAMLLAEAIGNARAQSSSPNAASPPTTLPVASPSSGRKASRQRGAAAADAAAAARSGATAAACENAHEALRASAAESVNVQLELIAQNERLACPKARRLPLRCLQCSQWCLPGRWPAPHLHLTCTSPAPPLSLQERLRGEVELLQVAADGVNRTNAAGRTTAAATAAGRANELELIAQNAQLRCEVEQLRAETEQLKVTLTLSLALGLTLAVALAVALTLTLTLTLTVAAAAAATATAAAVRRRR